jgi:hypothetical protein
MPTQVEAVANNALLGAGSVEMDEIEPQLDDATRGPCLDFVMHGSGLGMLECTTLGDTVLELGFSETVDPGVAKLGC